MRLYRKIIVSSIALALAGQFTALAAKGTDDGVASGAAAQSALIRSAPLIGMEVGTIDAQLIADAMPMVDRAPGGLFITAPFIDSLLVMNVRVYDSDGNKVMNARSFGEPLELMAIDLPNGEYRYEAVTVFMLDNPIGHGADYTDEGISRSFGTFYVTGDTLYENQRQVPHEEASVIDELIKSATYLAGVTLDVLIPSAHAANLTASSADPIVFFNDTDVTGADEWLIEGNGSFTDYRIIDRLGDNNHQVIDINGASGSSANSSSLVIDSDGDMHFAAGSMHLDDSSDALSLGWSDVQADISISGSTPDIRMHDETDTSEAELQLSNGVIQLWGRATDVALWQDIFDINVLAPDDTMKIDSFGLITLGAQTSTDLESILTLGNSSSPRAQMTLSSNDGTAHIEYGQSGNSLQFEKANGDHVVEFNMDAPLRSMILDSSGNLGVGTPIPTEAVDVSRSGAASRFQLTSFTDTGNQAAQFVQRRARGTSGAPTAVQNFDNLGLYSFRGHNGSGFTGTKASISGKATENWTPSANGTRLTFATTQNGTTGLNVVMEVTHDGKVKINGTALNVPDYVFEDDYQLMALDDLSAYISENKHLPGVASADEVNSGGLDIAGSQLSVLEKVEELTLYTLQQHDALKEMGAALKELDGLKAENAQLKADYLTLQENLEQVNQTVGLLMQRQENDQVLTSVSQ